MKKILCFIAAALVLLPLVLSAQEFDPARGPLEGVWKNETDDAGVIIFIGNLILTSEGNFTYNVMPGIRYRDGEILVPDEPGSEQMEYYTISYELSGNTLKLINDGYEEIYVQSGDGLLQNKSRLEGVWTTLYRDPDSPEIAANLTWIFTGVLMIMSVQSDLFGPARLYQAAEFSCSDEVITGPDDFTIPYTLSGDVLTLMVGLSGIDTIVLTRK
jgi:hypothetical protein